MIAVAKGEFRLRVCYPKAGRLRWLSHLEIVHSLERTVRRSGLRYAITQGFSPHLKAAFGPALPVGIGSEREYLDVYLREYTPAEEALRRLAGASPVDLAPREARYVPDGIPALTAAISVVAYTVVIGLEGEHAQLVQAAIESFVTAGELQVERKGKTKVFDLARVLLNEPRVSVGKEGFAVVNAAIRIGPEGSLRPDVLVQSALAASGIEAAVTQVTRTDAFVEHEDGALVRPL